MKPNVDTAFAGWGGGFRSGQKTVGSLKRLTRLMMASVVATAVLVAGPLADRSGGLRFAASPAHATGPASVADLAEKLVGAVVNISTSQKVKQNKSGQQVPQLPDGSPFQDFFDDIFPNQPGQQPDQPGQPENQSPEQHQDQQSEGQQPDGQDPEGQQPDGQEPEKQAPGENGEPGGENGDQGGLGKDPQTVQSLGSGFVIDSSGIIVTNNHVITDADEITVNFSDGSKLEAELVGTDLKTDIAVLRVKPPKPLAAVKFGNSDKARIGDWVMAIGNPFGLGGTVTLGIVSAIGRDINSGPYDNFIQTDASINRGNSGGPLFNMDGEVVGINTAIISPSGGSIGIGFSIPSSLASHVIEQLIKFGETRRGWLGVQIQSVTDEIAESLGLDKAAGALVGDVVKDGPAQLGGIQPGDVILSFDGHKIEHMRDLPRIVADTAVDKEVDVEILRKGKRVNEKVKVGRLEDGEKKLAKSEKPKAEANKPVVPTSKALGVTVRAITAEDRGKGKAQAEVQGVIITEVSAGSQAAEKGLKPGEIIVQVGQETVATPADFERLVGELKKGGRKNALLMVQTPTGEVRFVVVRID